MRIPLQQFFKTLLIKKGGGLWPDDTLATCYEHCLEQGANSIPIHFGKDKSDTQPQNIKYIKSSSDFIG